MSHPFERTVRANSVREDLQVGQQLHGVLIGFERRDGAWGPVMGEVAVMLIREGRTGDQICVPVLDQGVQRRLLDQMPQPGQSVTITCIGIVELGVTVRGTAVGFDIVPDQSEPVPEPDEDPDKNTPGIMSRSDSDVRTLRDQEVGDGTDSRGCKAAKHGSDA